MTTQTRKNIFETNSSSTHSISIEGDSRFLKPNLESIYECKFGEFGWGPDKLNYWEEKLSYVLTAIQYFDPDLREIWDDGLKGYIYPRISDFVQSKHFKLLKELFFDYTGSILVPVLNYHSWSPFGYIDHQSIDLLDYEFNSSDEEFKFKIKDLIFDNKYIIKISNNNNEYDNLD